MENDWIEIRGLKITTHIGVSEAERREAQSLLVDLRMRPQRNFSRMSDSISSTVDYFAVAQRVSNFATEQFRQLIERLADDIATMILQEFAVSQIEVIVRKFILAETEYVAVRCLRERNR